MYRGNALVHLNGLCKPCTGTVFSLRHEITSMYHVPPASEVTILTQGRNANIVVVVVIIIIHLSTSTKSFSIA